MIIDMALDAFTDTETWIILMTNRHHLLALLQGITLLETQVSVYIKPSCTSGQLKEGDSASR